MSAPARSAGRWLAARRAPLRLLMFRLLCGVAAVLGVYVAAALAGARHAGWIAASGGLVAAAAAAGSIRTVPGSFFTFAPLRRASATTAPAVLLAVAAVLFLAVLMPVLTTKVPAFDDYANHLARVDLIALHGSDALLNRFYSIRWRLVPNLGLDVLLPWLANTIGLFASGKMFVAASMLLLLTGPHAIQLALYRRLSAGPLVAAPFAYSMITKMGLLNYELGIGLALFATAGWVALRQTHPLLRALVSAGCVLAIFFCHLVALAVYGLAIGSFELWLLGAQPRPLRRIVTDLAVLVLPFVPAIPLLLLGPADHAAAIPWQWGGVHTRLDGLRYVVQAYYRDADVAAMAAAVAGFLWAVRRRILYFPPFGWIFLAVAAVVYLVTPDMAMGSWGAAGRLPTAFLLVILGFLHWDLSSHRLRRAFLLAVVVLTLFRAAAVEAVFWRFDRIRVDFETSLKQVSPGSRILIANNYPNEVEALTAPEELPCLAIIERSSLVSIAYSHPLQQILVVNPPYRAMTGGYDDAPIPLPVLLDPSLYGTARNRPIYDPSGRVYWSDWTHDYDYLYVLNPADPANPAPDRLDLLYNGDRFQLFRVRHS